jgi:serine/threonine protein kinase
VTLPLAPRARKTKSSEITRASRGEQGRLAGPDQTVAVKLLQAGDHSQAAERFAREAQVLCELRHPGIVEYLAHGVTGDGQPYLAMEWLAGEDLARRLARGALSLADSLTLLRRTASALAVAHQRGIVHRDLKPSNLFLRGGEVERVAILDFGIARRRALSHAITATGGVIGTPAYMAPEQARGERDLTPAVDVFSLGCVLFEIGDAAVRELERLGRAWLGDAAAATEPQMRPNECHVPGEPTAVQTQPT